VIRERQDIYEKVVEAPTVSYTTLPPQYAVDPLNNPSLMNRTGNWTQQLSGTAPSPLIRNDTPIPYSGTPTDFLSGAKPQQQNAFPNSANSFMQQK